MKPRRFPPPWSVEELDVCFVVRDHNGQQLAYVYFEDEPGRRSAAKLLEREAIAVPKLIRLTADFAGDFRHRECDVAILSLTRSHERRAVTFGDDPAFLRLALTRARQRIVFVGDPGTLCRRSQWEGPLDHLDEAQALREKTWVAALVKNLQGGGAATILLHEGPP